MSKVKVIRIQAMGDDDEVTIRNPPDARGDDEPEAVVLLRLRLAVAQEERRAKREERRMKEEERIAQERVWERERDRPTTQSHNRVAGNMPVAQFRDIKELLPSMTDGDDQLVFF